MKELRLAGISDIEGANHHLPGFAEELNAKFAKKPRNPVAYHRPIPEGTDLRNVFCLEETRTVGNDWVVRYKNRFPQILPQSNLPPVKNKVIVQEHLDDSIHLVYRDREVCFREIKELPQKHSVVSYGKPQANGPKRHPAPPQDHPWRIFNPLLYFSKRKEAVV